MAFRTFSSHIARTTFRAVLAASFLSLTSSVSSAATPTLTTSVAHVSTPDSHGRSALFVTLTNNGSLPITLLSVTSPALGMAMFFVDPNLNTATSPFAFAASFQIAPHATLTLGSRGKGMMLSRWHHSVSRTPSIPLVIHWFAISVEQTRVTATWLRPSPTLYFHYTSMVM
jgi:copper(I)-binding protein